MIYTKLHFQVFAVLVVFLGWSAQGNEPNAEGMLVIGHRGAPGHWGENTIAGFRHAIELGADGIELDLILTADHQLAVFHDWELNRLIGENQLNSEYPDRAVVIDGERVWLTRDFTMDELQVLTVLQRGSCATAEVDAIANPELRICSYEQALDLFDELRHERSDLVLYTEVKTNAKYLTSEEIDKVAGLVVNELVEAGELEHPESHWLQSFDSVVMDSFVSIPLISEFKKSQLLSCEPGLVTSANPVILDIEHIESAMDLRDFLSVHVGGRGMQIVHGWKLMWWHLITVKQINCAEIMDELNLDMHAFTFRDSRFSEDYEGRPVLAPDQSKFRTASEETGFFRSNNFDAIMSDCIESAIEQ